MVGKVREIGPLHIRMVEKVREIGPLHIRMVEKVHEKGPTCREPPSMYSSTMAI